MLEFWEMLSYLRPCMIQMLSFQVLNIVRVSILFTRKINPNKFNRAMKDWKTLQKEITFYMIE